MKVILGIPDGMVSALDAEAKRTQRTRSEVVRAHLRFAMPTCVSCSASKPRGAWCVACFGCSSCGGLVCGGRGCAGAVADAR